MMGSLMDYLKWRGDLTFRERPLQEVDNLILSELAYFHFEDVLDDRRWVTLREANERRKQKPVPNTYGSNNPLALLAACAATERFGSLIVTNFVNRVDRDMQMQFAAVTYELPDGSVFVAFRGTDNTLVGWREDFNLSFMNETPAQAQAVQYLNATLRARMCPVTVGGHSKGGNLAIYAAAFCDEKLQHRIRLVYSNDGPGFNQYVANHPNYLSILPKVRLILPEASVIGMILSNKGEKKIIQSSGETGVKQHLPYTWLVERDHFLTADGRTSTSVLLDDTLDRWIDTLDLEERRDFVTALFDALEASGASTLDELNTNPLAVYDAILKALATQKRGTRNILLESVRKLATAGREVIRDEAKKRHENQK